MGQREMEREASGREGEEGTNKTLKLLFWKIGLPSLEEGQV